MSAVHQFRPAITSKNLIDQVDDEWFVWCLDNWRRWAQAGDDCGPKEPSRCISAERDYRIPWWEQDPNDVGPATAAPCERAGQLVETLWSGLPKAERDVVRFHFVEFTDARLRRRWNAPDSSYDVAAGDAWRARKMSMPAQAYLDHLRSAIARLHKGLHDRVMMPLSAARKA